MSTWGEIMSDWESISGKILQKQLMKTFTKQRTYDRDTKYLYHNDIPYDNSIPMTKSDALWLTKRSIVLFMTKRAYVCKNNTITPLLYQINDLPPALFTDILKFL